MHPRVRGAIALAALLVPSSAIAQTPDQPTAAPAEPAKPNDAPPSPAVPPAERVPTVVDGRDLGPAGSAAEGRRGSIDKPSLPEPQTSAAGFSWQPFGYLRMQYVAVQNDPNVAFVGRNDGFELQNARIAARGKLGTRAAFVLSFDGAIDERTQQDVPQGLLGFGMRDAYVDIALAGNIVARGGYFQCWLDPQAQIPDTAREFVDLPIETRGVRPTQGFQTPGLPPGRSIGAGIRLDPEVPTDGARFGFELTAQNGSDEFSSNNDNDTLALSAAAIVRFPHDGWVVAAGRWNPRTVGMLPFRQDETDLQGSLGAHIAAGPVSLGGGLIVQQTTYESTGGPSQNAYGAHAQLMIRIPAPLPLAIGYRFGVLDPSSLITTDQVMEHTAGAVLGVPSLRMRLQLQLTHVVEQPARDLSDDRAQLAAEIVL